TVLLGAAVDLWAYLAGRLLSGPAHELAYGKKVLLPQIGRHLVLAFILSQLAVAAVLAAALPLFVRLTGKLWPARGDEGPAALTGAAGVQALREGLGRVLRSHRRALEAIVDLCVGGHRARGMQS